MLVRRSAVSDLGSADKGHGLSLSALPARIWKRVHLELIFREKTVAFKGASPSTYTHRSPDHGRLLHYSFCPTCGTRLGVVLDRSPALQFIYSGAYDDTSWVKPAS